MVFGFLCLDTKKPGGPQIYAKMIFGEKIAFFVTWLYWCGAWVCNPILISASIDYLEQVIGPINVILRFLLEITIIIIEGTFYKKKLKYKRINPYLISLILNIVSYSFSLLIKI